MTMSRVYAGERSLLLKSRDARSRQREQMRSLGFLWVYLLMWIVCGAVVVYVGLGELESAGSVPNDNEARRVEEDEETCKEIYATFPNEFVWGAATSAFQIEGGRQERSKSIWDTFCENPANCHGENGDVACDHYYRVDQDVKMMKALGLRAYRFSLSWPRIMNEGNVVNQKGIAFYNHLIDQLIAHDIEPWITLYHWDLPQYLEDAHGGWLSGSTVDAFTEYSRICFGAFGDRVTRWITINESWTVAVNGYNGVHAPGHHASAIETYLVAHNLLLAHAKAVAVYRSDFQPSQKGLIGISNNGDYRYPASEDADGAAAERAMIFQLSWFADPIWMGDYPQEMKNRIGDRLPTFTDEEKELLMGSSDFFGLNHYTSLLAAEPAKPPTYEGYWADIHVDFSFSPSWPKTDMGWSVVPDGCRKLLEWIARRYNNPVVYMTENGSSFPETDVDVALKDVSRQRYLENYLRACAEAISEGNIRLGGYFAWSLMDNFEWQYGYSKRFGLVHVDFDTLQRTPKQSALWYRETIAKNGRTIVMRNGTCKTTSATR